MENIESIIILILVIITIILFVISMVLQMRNVKGFKQISEDLDELEILLDKELETRSIKEYRQYLNNTKQMFECPYDCERRSCKHMNTATGYIDISCHDCDWFDSGVRPSVFTGRPDPKKVNPYETKKYHKHKRNIHS